MFLITFRIQIAVCAQGIPTRAREKVRAPQWSGKQGTQCTASHSNEQGRIRRPGQNGPSIVPQNSVDMRTMASTK